MIARIENTVKLGTFNVYLYLVFISLVRLVAKKMPHHVPNARALNYVQQQCGILRALWQGKVFLFYELKLSFFFSKNWYPTNDKEDQQRN